MSEIVRHDFPEIDPKWHSHVKTRFAGPFVGKKIERVDVDPIILGCTAQWTGYTVRDFNEKGDLAVAMVAYCNEMFDLLPVTHWFYSNVWLEELGAKLECTKTLPWIVVGDRPVPDPEAVEKLRIPDVEEMDKGPCCQRHYVAYDYEKKYLPNMMLPMAHTFCFTSMAAELMGPEKYIMMMFRQPDVCHKLVHKIAMTSANGAIAIANRYGFSFLVIGSVLANSDVIPAKYIKEFHLDHVNTYLRETLRGGGGPQLWYHCCGNHELDYPLFHDVYSTPFTVLHFGYHGKGVFPSELYIKEGLDRKFTIMGSVDTKDMWHAKHQVIRETAKRQIEGGIDAKRGFILGTACETPMGSPATSVYTLVKAARDFGSYE